MLVAQRRLNDKKEHGSPEIKQSQKKKIICLFNIRSKIFERSGGYMMKTHSGKLFGQTIYFLEKDLPHAVLKCREF